MNISEYKNIFDNEESHFFYVGNHKLVLSLLKESMGNRREIKILDAGCGTGLLAKKLKDFGKVWAIDLSEEAIKFARKRGLNARQASVTKLPFTDEFFDAVTSIDVIYHKKVNDQKALQEILRVLKPGGVLILRVPANKNLKLAHDVHVHTRERYDKEELRIKLKSAGFQIEKLSFVNMLLLPLAFGRHLLEGTKRDKPVSGIGRVPSFLNKILLAGLSWEPSFLRFSNIPFGLGLIGVCRKPR